MHVVYAAVITCAWNRIMLKEIPLARSLAPEDIQVGSFVMTLHTQNQIMMSKCSQMTEPQVVVVPVITRPSYPELPAKVVAICLPFIVVKREDMKTEVIDTRSHRLAQVPKAFAKTAWAPHQPKKSKKKKKKKGK